MTKTGNILALDQGTTSSRAILFNENLTPQTQAQREFTQHFPKSGWVEHDPEEIWTSTIESCREAMSGKGRVACIGITNQRETVIVWDRNTGKPVCNAIVWQDRRTAEFCRQLKEDGQEADISRRTGLLLDPYFSASKLTWILDHVPGARDRAEAGELLFGTVDSFLVWRLTGGRRHVTDATNASRTMLFNIDSGEWDPELLELFRVPAAMMPEVLDCAAEFGTSDPTILGSPIPILGIAGDQQAATVGQACFKPGMLKSTYGTGCFALMNTGVDRVASANRLLTTIAYRIGGRTTFALEGSIFIAGAVVQWLRDGIGLIANAAESGTLAETADPEQNVLLVPAFTGLGAPYWDAECRGAVFGLTRNTGPAEFARAALESVAFQTRDLAEAMKSDMPDTGNTVLRVDGGMTASEWTMQAISDQLGAPVDVPAVTETTALGAAYLAGLQAGIVPAPEEFAANWLLAKRFEPKLSEEERNSRYAAWMDAVARTLSGSAA
ncbi:MAG: glycerol kinase GlpK [Rhodobacteraceae bacterium]|nr:glycerol kinase GlpK [Paracoccaceae bacterium]